MTPNRLAPLLAALALAANRILAAGPSDWPEYYGGPERNHYSSLDQITPDNVGQLTKAWEFHTGDFGNTEVNPLVVDGVLYGESAANSVFALDAATGRQLWRYDPPGEKTNRILRGVALWGTGDDRRVLFTLDEWLIALDARTGRPIAAFGIGGRTSLKAGLGPQAEKKDVHSTTPGTVVGNLIVMPTTVAETEDAALGWIQAFDVRSGKLVWVFHTIPLPGELGYDTWSPDAYKNTTVGSANCWAGMAVDRPRGILYVPTGSAAPDFWGGDRKGADLFANCLLALEAGTGKLLWYYQFVHHDIWDLDLPAPPALLTVHRDGRSIDAVAQTTKTGHVFVFDRVTGKPLFPIQEVPVQKTDLEETWPTQPRPLKPAAFTRQTITEADISPYAPNRAELVARFRKASLGWFPTLGSHREAIMSPGFVGGGEWGGPAVDPRGVLYVNASEHVIICSLGDDPAAADLTKLGAGGRLYAVNCAICHGSNREARPANEIPSLAGVDKRLTREQVEKLIATGRGRMAAFPMLTAADRKALADYLFGVDRPAGAEGSASLAPIRHGHVRHFAKWVDSDGNPAVRPPWGTLTAIDLNTGEQLWRVSLGEFKSLTAKGIPPTGAENRGGPIVTGSGLLFVAATTDGMFRAFSTATGKLLWQTTLPATGFSTPSTYRVGNRQYVVVVAGGSNRETDKSSGDSYIAYALPE